MIRSSIPHSRKACCTSPTRPRRAAGVSAAQCTSCPTISLTIPPDGFDGNDDAWHYHDDLCIWNAGSAVEEDVPQATCLARPQPIWIEKAGWLVHLWNYHLNPRGRFVEVNNALTSGPAPSTATVAVDADPAVAGVQTSRAVGGATFTVDVVASGLTDVGAFNFDIQYDPAVLAAPAVARETVATVTPMRTRRSSRARGVPSPARRPIQRRIVPRGRSAWRASPARARGPCPAQTSRRRGRSPASR